MAIIGWPNVGKSTLLNHLLKAKLSIISPKPQTTRETIRGILNEPNVQAIFLDTPGWLKPNGAFQQSMKKEILRSVYDDADAILWMLEPAPLTDEQKEFGVMMAKTGKPICAAISKCDVQRDPAMLDALVKELKTLLPPDSFVLRISARSGLGMTDLKNFFMKKLPEGEPFFPTDQMTDKWERFFVEEFIRETIFNTVHEEVPHASYVKVEEFDEREGRKDHIKATIYVETEGQKRILIGLKGQVIRQIGEKSRQEIEKLLNRPVYLELIVKIKKNWRTDGLFLKQMEERDR